MTRALMIVVATAALAACTYEATTPPALFGGRSQPQPQAATMTMAAPPQTQPQTQTQSQPQTQPQVASAPGATSSVVGSWRGTVRDRSRGGAEMQDLRLDFNADGTYRSTAQFPEGGAIAHWGRYVVGDGFIRLQIMGWAPRQVCGADGCFPVAMPDSDTIVVMSMDPRQIVTEQGPLARVQ